MKKIITLLIFLFISGCSTGNDPFMTRSQSQSYCEKIKSKESDYSICVRQLMLPKKYIESCFRNNINPGTSSFNDCVKSVLNNTVSSDSNTKEKNLQDELNNIKKKNKLKEIIENNKVIQ